MEKWKRNWIKKTIPDLAACNNSTDRRTLYTDLATRGTISSQVLEELLRNEDLVARLNLKDSSKCRLRIANYLFDKIVARYDGFVPYVDALFRTSLSNAFVLVCTGILEHLATEKKNLFSKNVLESIYMATVTKKNLWNTLKGYFHSIMTKENDWYDFLVTLEVNDWELPYELTEDPFGRIISNPLEISSENWKHGRMEKYDGNFFRQVILKDVDSSSLWNVNYYKYPSKSITTRLTTIVWDNANDHQSWNLFRNDANFICRYQFVSREMNSIRTQNMVTELQTTDLNKELPVSHNDGPINDPKHYNTQREYTRHSTRMWDNLKGTPWGRKFAKYFNFDNNLYPDWGYKKSTFVAPKCRQALVTGVPYTAQDIYSFGATCSYVMSFNQPCSAKNETNFDLLNKTTQLNSAYLSCAQDIIEYMMDKIPGNRKILMDPFSLSLKINADVMRDFAFALDTTKPELKDQIDRYFISGWEGEFDWLNKIGTNTYDLLRTFKSTGYKKDYNTKSITSLAILFRNKLCHPKDVVEELTILKTRYNGELVFDWKKYTSFFLEKMPELWRFVYKLVRESQYSQHFSNVLLNLEHWSC